jgi:hypothetical protein
VRNVDPGERVAIVFESADSEESTTDGDEPTVEGGAPTEEPRDDAGPGEASRPSLRNVVPDGLDITFKRSGDYDFEVSSRDIDVFDRATDDPDAPAAPDLSMDALDDDGKRFVSETNQRPVGFIEVDTKFDSEKLVEEATQKFRVRKSYLAATGASVESVTLSRDETGGRRALLTRQTTADEEFYHFEADTPGFSVFAIGTSSPVFDTNSAEIVSFNETTGAIEADVTVENTGSASGEFVVRFVAGNETIGFTTVTLAPGESSVVTVTGELTGESATSVTIAGESLGEVGPVTQSASSTDESSDSASTDTTDETSEPASTDSTGGVSTLADESSGSLDILGMLVPIGALALVLFFILWRRSDDEDERDMRAHERIDE